MVFKKAAVETVAMVTGGGLSQSRQQLSVDTNELSATRAQLLVSVATLLTPRTDSPVQANTWQNKAKVYFTSLMDQQGNREFRNAFIFSKDVECWVGSFCISHYRICHFLIRTIFTGHHGLQLIIPARPVWYFIMMFLEIWQKDTPSPLFRNVFIFFLFCFLDK